jgi:uncharacterized protein YegP (UPF0339 family)
MSSMPVSPSAVSEPILTSSAALVGLEQHPEIAIFRSLTLSCVTGKFSICLNARNGDVIGQGDAYESRDGAHGEPVQRAAAGASIKMCIGRSFVEGFVTAG